MCRSRDKPEAMTTLWLSRGLIVAVLPELFPATISLAQPQLCASHRRRRLVAVPLATLAHGIANLTARDPVRAMHSYVRPNTHVALRLPSGLFKIVEITLNTYVA
jgi:hypothetical protein